MKRIRILGMALVAVLAMSAVAVAIASAAAPEFSPATNSGTSKSATATFTEEGEAFSIKCTSNTGTSNAGTSNVRGAMSFGIGRRLRASSARSKPRIVRFRLRRLPANIDGIHGELATRDWNGRNPPAKALRI